MGTGGKRVASTADPWPKTIHSSLGSFAEQLHWVSAFMPETPAKAMLWLTPSVSAAEIVALLAGLLRVHRCLALNRAAAATE
jgi:hypothetical protein